MAPPSEATEPGKLYVVATPIGNLEDITLRALRILKEVDLIAAEDTRRTRRLLAHYNISTPLTSYYDQIERKKAPALLDKLRAGQSIGLVSDAGTPGIADPGYRLVQGAWAGRRVRRARSRPVHADRPAERRRAAHRPVRL